MKPFKEVTTAQAPVNIAVIKYWGKIDEKLKIPLNDSLSGTLNTSEMKTVTSVYIDSEYEEDQLILNNIKQELSERSPARIMLDDIRKMSPYSDDRSRYKVHVISSNNFPTAAGLASSAAGYACLAYALGHAFGIKDVQTLSKIARKGSGSACRSLFGGFVQWERGVDHETSVAKQIVDHLHWPEMRVLICVVNDEKKDVSSSSGMANSVKSSELIKYRADHVVPERISAIKEAIVKRDFEMFANITMQDSNQFHAICLDTFPPLFYLNDTSRQIIRICTLVNSYYEQNKVAYTFDAGPNACIYLLDNFIDLFVELIRHFFPRNGKLTIKGNSAKSMPDKAELESLIKHLESNMIEAKTDSINYLISTTIGEGPKLIDNHLEEFQK